MKEKKVDTQQEEQVHDFSGELERLKQIAHSLASERVNRAVSVAQTHVETAIAILQAGKFETD